MVSARSNSENIPNGDSDAFFDGTFLGGEHFGENLSRPVARHANDRMKSSNPLTTALPLRELGEPATGDVRFRDSVKQGFVTAYVRSREIADNHETITKITIGTVAIGTVLAGVAALKHRQK